VSFGQAIVLKGAGLDVVWPDFLVLTGLGLALLTMRLADFRRSLVEDR
jgi:ABC-2 type transport system permease protein